MTEMKKCKKCNRNLPSAYKYNKCEACRNKNVDAVKKFVKAVGVTTVSGVGAVLLGAVSGDNVKANKNDK